MTPFLTLTRRELAGYFLNLRGYVILAGVQLFLGASLLLATHQAEGMAMGMTMLMHTMSMAMTTMPKRMKE